MNPKLGNQKKSNQLTKKEFSSLPRPLKFFFHFFYSKELI